MELYEAIRKRRTVREFLKKEVDFEAIKRIRIQAESVLHDLVRDRKHLPGGDRRRAGLLHADSPQ